MAVGVLLALTGCSPVDDGTVVVEDALNSEACEMSGNGPKPTSLADLLARPADFQGKLVSVEGYYCAGFEINALYATPDCDTRPEDGLWLGGMSPFYSSEGRKVIVVGVFDGRLQGHLAKWPAGICTSKLLEVRQP